MRILALDLSTHAGYAVFEAVVGEGQKPTLLESGTVHLGRPVHEFGNYPYGYVKAAAAQLVQIWHKLPQKFDVIVVEETNAGRNRYVQKLLEFLHSQLVRDAMSHQTTIVYVDSGEWRRTLDLRLSKDQRKQNSKLSKAKRAAAEAGAQLDKAALGIRGKVTWKHLAVAKANEAYGLGLKMKDNDTADAICLGLAYCLGATICDGV